MNSLLENRRFASILRWTLAASLLLNVLGLALLASGRGKPRTNKQAVGESAHASLAAEIAALESEIDAHRKEANAEKPPIPDIGWVRMKKPARAYQTRYVFDHANRLRKPIVESLQITPAESAEIAKLVDTFQGHIRRLQEQYITRREWVDSTIFETVVSVPFEVHAQTCSDFRDQLTIILGPERGAALGGLAMWGKNFLVEGFAEQSFQFSASDDGRIYLNHLFFYPNGTQDMTRWGGAHDPDAPEIVDWFARFDHVIDRDAVLQKLLNR